MKWVGPFIIDELLDNCIKSLRFMPPESNGVYLVSKKRWVNIPTQKCIPLYVGSNTGNSKRFRTRVGDLISDMFGFFIGKKGHSSGGRNIFKYCRKRKINPKVLYIGWLKKCECMRCEENRVYLELKPILNEMKPKRCKLHE